MMRDKEQGSFVPSPLPPLLIYRIHIISRHGPVSQTLLAADTLPDTWPMVLTCTPLTLSYLARRCLPSLRAAALGFTHRVLAAEAGGPVRCNVPHGQLHKVHGPLDAYMRTLV